MKNISIFIWKFSFFGGKFSVYLNIKRVPSEDGSDCSLNPRIRWAHIMQLMRLEQSEDQRNRIVLKLTR